MASESGNEERKNVALKALERRFALAQDQLLQQQQQPKRNRPLPKHKPQLSTYNNNNNIVATNSSLHQKPITTLSSSNHSVKKDTETNDPVYSLLSHPVHENLVSTNVEISDRKGSIPDKILHELLRNGDAAQKYNQGSKSKKFDNWILLDNVDKGSGAYDRARIKALNKNSKRSKKHMSMKQHKKFGSLTLPDDSHNFEIYKPMHEMWKGYITQVLKNVGNNQFAQCLLSADLHGAIILVVQSKIVSFVGVSGIMIRETAETFSVISADNKFQVVPKKSSVFMLQADRWKITLIGDELRSRNMGP
ncbi:Ribonuclease P protein subunit p29 [Heracleum sosnowskyi]|uniref:Ribonuclease P protein subunit p29 n=1 Tax=Heracleum sosnowskyi TaxID=360622 RepID=A0AAD8IVZ2_9APIA|nr:Ribonuclease P protein subunit p29 [Heracleum sosnowskyi]